MFDKQFKDPIYGYIEIDSKLVSEVIDTPAFQRLKDIRQTSYTPLYPAAYHNRYIHSLGVYHLGRIAFGAIKSQFEDEDKSIAINGQLSKIQNIFELACLLHDVGHAPFSHTGEAFYLDKQETLYRMLKECVNEDKFTIDFNALGAKKPAPHECMSCIVGIKTFPDYFKESFERELFARCIIGMPIQFTAKDPKYNGEMNSEEKQEVTKQRDDNKVKRQESELLNCVISLLNSSIIDVDRLDYIIRDAETIGFQSIKVDYLRLLRGLRIVSYNGRFCIGYHKSAVSVIESAVYAHDAEKKWVQGHPAILYEMEALKNAMGELTNIFSTKHDSNPLFCYEALTEEGKTLSMPVQLFADQATQMKKEDLWSAEALSLLQDGKLFAKDHQITDADFMITRNYPVSLLADEDFLFLLKYFCKEGLGYEYFARNRRRQAMWKSEAEFRALFQQRIGDDTENIKTLERDFEGLVDYCQDKMGVPIVSEAIFDILDKEKSDANSARDNKEIDGGSYDDIINGIKSKRHWARILCESTKKLDIKFEFLIIFQKKFNSSFKETLGDIPILFPNIEHGVVPLKTVVDVLKASADRKSNFFHLFYTPNGVINAEKKRQIVNQIAQALVAGINYK